MITLFSIYRNHSERPLYVIEKNPKLRERQGQYVLISQHGRVLKRGQELDNVLRVLEIDSERVDVRWIAPSASTDDPSPLQEISTERIR